MRAKMQGKTWSATYKIYMRLDSRQGGMLGLQ